ncbi:Arc family DNA-binding protein [Stenotrophomonas acidaminiphila]|uniref:Arc family DNA-binding protein n=1 Tax=Stenotrophomonas acidaminiphila TaxID=128780 RepID=UPI003BF33F00
MNTPDTQFKLRLPAELKAKLDDQAAAAGRSLSAEIVYRLELSFAAGQYRGAAEQGLGLATQLAETVKVLQRQLKERDEAMQRMSAFIDTMGARMDELQKAVATPKKSKPKP